MSNSQYLIHEAPVPAAEKAVANGVATLDGSGKLPVSQLPASVTSGLVFQGTWDANMNSPALTNGGGGGVQGDYYRVSVAGATSLDGITDWKVNDWVTNEGSAWSKIDNTESVVSVAGRDGAVTLSSADLTDIPAAAASTLLQGGSITATEIANDTITATQIAAGAIGTAELAALAVTEAKVAALAVTEGKIAALAVTGAKIANDTITATQIASGAIGTAELAALAVTPAKLAVRDASETLSAQFPNAVTAAVGSGSLIANNNAIADGNHYEWTSTSATLQKVSIYLQVPVPSDFADWDNATDTDNIELRMATGLTATADNVINVSVYGTDGSLVGTPAGMSTLASTVADAVETKALGWASGTFAPGDFFTIQFDLEARVQAGSAARIYNVKLNYRRQ